MGKHVYQMENAVTKYDRSHGFVDLQGKEFPKVSAFRAEIVESICSTLEKSVSVLDIGVGHGKWLFIPLILRLLRDDKLKFAIGMDNSDNMLTLLTDNLLSEHISPKAAAINKLYRPQGGASSGLPPVYTVRYDIEELVYNCTLTEFKADKMPKVDILLLMGVLHHTINWRQTLHVIVNSFFKSGSIIILSERDCESDYLDGNFYNQFNYATNMTGECTDIDNSKWRDIWYRYYELRKDIGAPWKPEIRVSDISSVLLSLYDMGFELVRKPFYEIWTVVHSMKEIDNWLEDPVFSNFYRSLTKEDIDNLHIKLMKIFNVKDYKTISVNEGWKFYILRKKA